ncbi:MAG TPA: nucleotidyltransferase, partial [Caldisericia bacterium]|nr:nucleotidyltransferase [Caldisericia bacterium]
MLSKDFIEFIALLNKNKVKYLVVGGYAVAIHGYPRYTKDLDFWIDISPDNIHQLLITIKEFGFGSLNLKFNDFAEPGYVIQLGYPPCRIDLLTSLEGVSFKECYSQKNTLTIDGVSVDFIDLPHLRINKKSTGRSQDQADLENLK